MNAPPTSSPAQAHRLRRAPTLRPRRSPYHLSGPAILAGPGPRYPRGPSTERRLAASPAPRAGSRRAPPRPHRERPAASLGPRHPSAERRRRLKRPVGCALPSQALPTSLIALPLRSAHHPPTSRPRRSAIRPRWPHPSTAVPGPAIHNAPLREACLPPGRRGTTDAVRLVLSLLLSLTGRG